MRRPLLTLMLALVAAPAAAQAPASVQGRISVGVAEVKLADAGPIVVYLEAVAAPAPPPAPTAQIRQHLARFEPAFTVVPVGAEVRMPNEDTIFHNVFSYSRPNDFDLGLYGSGEARSVRFRSPGLVRIYCSIHEKMNGVIYVTPSSLYTLPDARGAYRITGVPPGRYRLRAWSERLPMWTRDVVLQPGKTAEVEVRLLALGG